MNHRNMTNKSIDVNLVANALAFILPKAGFSDLLLSVSPEENEIIISFKSERAIGDFYAKTGLTPSHHMSELVQTIMAIKHVGPTQIAVFELMKFPELYFALEAIAFPDNKHLN